MPEAIEKVLPAIAQAVDLAAAALKAGGRLIYLGAGTSGRPGVLDASECPPTFGVPHGVVVGLIAGGPGALLKAVEGAEDDEALGEADLRALNLTAVDMVVGLAASGRTPYVIGALRYARGLGCPTAAISCNPDSPIAHEAQVAISPVVGPEADRLDAPEIRLCAEAGAQHAVDRRDGQAGQGLQNLMVDVKATNVKLVDRACRIVVEATGAERAQAEAALAQTGFEVKPAILMILAGVSAEEAQQRLQRHDGYLRAALAR